MMAKSPLALGLKIRFVTPVTRAEPDAYRAFTTVFDEIVGAEELDSVLGPPNAKVLRSYQEAISAFSNLFNGERVEIAASGVALVRDLKQTLQATDRAQTVVSLLIDHSGSMRGIRMMSALLAVEGAVDALKHAGIAFEILGFTTSSWKGGKSRRAWRWAGRPSNPGRLCDLLHIVYHPADRGPASPPRLAPALRPDLLHENIDGEALAWAASRLDASRWSRRIICLISDGAPVDDSTLTSNQDRDLLIRHLESTERQLLGQGIVVGTLLIGEDSSHDTALLECADEPQEAGAALMRLLRRTLIDG